MSGTGWVGEFGPEEAADEEQRATSEENLDGEVVLPGVEEELAPGSEGRLREFVGAEPEGELKGSQGGTWTRHTPTTQSPRVHLLESECLID